MTKIKPHANCYGCIYRGTVPGDAHSCCHHPAIKVDTSDMFMALEAMLSGRTNEAAFKLKIKGNQHGVDAGYFFWPANFDPVWLENCDGYTPKEKP